MGLADLNNLTQEDIAFIAGVSRVTVIRAMKKILLAENKNEVVMWTTFEEEKKEFVKIPYELKFLAYFMDLKQDEYRKIFGGSDSDQ